MKGYTVLYFDEDILILDKGFYTKEEGLSTELSLD